jgi:hypothetical protein
MWEISGSEGALAVSLLEHRLPKLPSGVGVERGLRFEQAGRGVAAAVWAPGDRDLRQRRLRSIDEFFEAIKHNGKCI